MPCTHAAAMSTTHTRCTNAGAYSATCSTSASGTAATAASTSATTSEQRSSRCDQQCGYGGYRKQLDYLRHDDLLFAFDSARPTPGNTRGSTVVESRAFDRMFRTKRD